MDDREDNNRRFVGKCYVNRDLLGNNVGIEFIKNFCKDITIISNKKLSSANSLTINLTDFKQKITANLKHILKIIDCTLKQKQIILSTSIKILTRFISRLKNNKYNIPKNVNIRIIATSIIFTVLVSDNNMMKIDMAKILSKNKESISLYYKKYFKHFYPKIDINITSRYGFSQIKDKISLYFFKLLRERNFKTSKLICLVEEDIRKKSGLFNQLTQKEINILNDILVQGHGSFIEYFSDLVEVSRYLINIFIIHKKIGAHLIIKKSAEFMYEKGINLLQNFSMFYQSVNEIANFLKKSSPNICPILYRSNKGLSYKERQEKRIRYIKIVGSRIKLYIIKNIYNGLYIRNGNFKCPECEKEGFKINTYISRLKAIESHHSKEKKFIFSANNLYSMFNDNQANPLFLDNLIKLMEVKHIKILCGNHHDLLNYKYFNYFNHLIAWKDIPKSLPQDIFSLSPELIHVLIRISVDHFSKTKNKSIKSKDNIRIELVRLLKKRYIIEIVYGEYCHICGEFNTKEHLYSFQFCHSRGDKKTVSFSKLSKYFSCSKIAKILEQEEGGFVCSNCHTVFDSKKYIPLLDKIYDDKNVIKDFLKDYKSFQEKFTLFHKIEDIKNPLEQSMKISDSFETYLIAIFEILKSGQVVTNHSLADYLHYTNSTAPLKFFNRNANVMKQYVYINKNGKETKYSLTNKGKEALSLINYFKKYYSSI